MNDKLCDCLAQSQRCSKTCGHCTADAGSDASATAEDASATILTPSSSPGFTTPQDPEGRDTTAAPGPRPVSNHDPISPDGAKLLLRGKRQSARQSKMMSGWKDGGSKNSTE